MMPKPFRIQKIVNSPHTPLAYGEEPTEVFGRKDAATKHPFQNSAGSKIGSQSYMKLPAPFAKYLLLERIGLGSMTEIFLARSRGIQGFRRLVAIKTTNSTAAKEESLLSSFAQEARIMAELSHSGIANIFDFDQFKGLHFMVMEYVHGKDLGYVQFLAEKESFQVPIPIAAYITCKICEALDYAHGKRDITGRPLEIVHQDISPANVIISYEGEIKLCDWGMAKASHRANRCHAITNQAVFPYLSPEQAQGQPTDRRADIYNLGMLLLELTSGRQWSEPCRTLASASTIRHNIPEDLAKIIRQALQRHPSHRFQTAAQCADALRGFLNRCHPSVGSKDVGHFMRSHFIKEQETELRRIQLYQGSSSPILPPGRNKRDTDSTRAKTLLIHKSNRAPASPPTIFAPSESLGNLA